MPDIVCSSWLQWTHCRAQLSQGGGASEKEYLRKGKTSSDRQCTHPATLLFLLLNTMVGKIR